jgi:hypothetical protein
VRVHCDAFQAENPAVTTTANGSAMSQPMSEQFNLIRESGDISGFRLQYGSRPNDPMPFVLTLTPQYVARALGKSRPVTYLEIAKYVHDNAGDLRAKAAFEKGRGGVTLTLEN